MGIFSTNRRAVDLFEQRFEEDGSGYLFRARPRSAPVRITARERDDFVEAFAAFNRWSAWSGLAFILPTTLALFWIFERRRQEVPEAWLYVVAVLWVAGFSVAYWAAWTAPTRALANRRVVGEGRSREAAKRAALERLGWRQLVVLAGFAALIATGAIDEGRPAFMALKGLGGLGLLGLVVVQAWRKWRLRYTPPPP